MKTQRLAIALTVLNLVLLLFVTARTTSTAAETSTPIVRTRALELVDNRGQVRAQLNVESDGEVVFRLRDARGAIRVKLGADADGSGLLLADETTEPAVHIIARRTATSWKQTTTSITLSGADRQKRVLKPDQP